MEWIWSEIRRSVKMSGHPIEDKQLDGGSLNREVGVRDINLGVLSLINQCLEKRTKTYHRKSCKENTRTS